MIDERVIVELLKKLPTLRGDQISDVLLLINDAWKGDDAEEIAKTLLEIVEPERIGRIKWM